MNPCPDCDHPRAPEVATCANCGHVLANGAATAGKSPPPGMNGLVIHKTPPEMVAEGIRTFDEDEFLAELREVERNGGAELKDFIHQLEQEVPACE